MNLLLVDSAIPSVETFLNGVNQNTKVVTYTISNSYEQLKEKISDLKNIHYYAINSLSKDND